MFDLVSGVECFYISIPDSQTGKTGKSVILKFHVVQPSRNTKLMKKLISSFFMWNNRTNIIPRSGIFSSNKF